MHTYLLPILHYLNPLLFGVYLFFSRLPHPKIGRSQHFSGPYYALIPTLGSVVIILLVSLLGCATKEANKNPE